MASKMPTLAAMLRTLFAPMFFTASVMVVSAANSRARRQQGFSVFWMETKTISSWNTPAIHAVRNGGT